MNIENGRKNKRQKMQENKGNLLIGLFTLLGVIVLIAVIGWIVLRPEEEPIQGEVEAKEIRISGKIAARIAEIKVDEGMFVHKGDTLVLLSSPELQAKLSQAEAAENAAQAQHLKAMNGTRQEQINAAFEMWEKAKAGTEIAQKSFERARKLFDKEVIPAQKFDEANAQYKAAIATEKAAKAQYDMAVNGAQTEDKMASKALVDRAKGAVSEVQAFLPETMLTSPIDGEISEIFLSQGELVGQGAPIINLIDLNDSWISFNIKEQLLATLPMGKEVFAKIPALNNQRIKLKVTYIKALGSYATWKATKTTGEFDVKTFEVRLKPVEKVEGLRPGMSVLLEK